MGYLKIIVRCRTTSRTTSCDVERRRGSSHDICAIDVRWRYTTSSMIVRRRRTQSKTIRHRTTVIRSSYDHRATLIYKTILASHYAIIVKSYVIVRLSYDAVRCSTISQKLSMCRKPIVSGMTTKLRLQYRSRIRENFRNIRCHPSHDVAARCDQSLAAPIRRSTTWAFNKTKIPFKHPWALPKNTIYAFYIVCRNVL